MWYDITIMYCDVILNDGMQINAIKYNEMSCHVIVKRGG
jgi:hypothetical protein